MKSWYISLYRDALGARAGFDVPQYFVDIKDCIISICIDLYDIPEDIGKLISYYLWFLSFQSNHDVILFIKKKCIHSDGFNQKVACSLSCHHFGSCVTCFVEFGLRFLCKGCPENQHCNINCLDCFQKHFRLCHVCYDIFCIKSAIKCYVCNTYYHRKHVMQSQNFGVFNKGFICRACSRNAITLHCKCKLCSKNKYLL